MKNFQPKDGSGPPQGPGRNGGRIKTAAGVASVKVRGKPKVDASFALTLAVCNLIRIPKLLARPAP